MTAPTDLVVLLPGFLGFDHFGGFPYFGQIVSTAIRVALEEQRGARPVTLEVVPSTTVPAGSLAKRQRALLDQLARMIDRPTEVPRLHLVGHSTGGLDAELLTRRTPLAGEWSQQDQRVRGSIRSIVTIASPLRGTSLSDSPLGRFLATAESPSWESVREWLRVNAAFKGLWQFLNVMEDAFKLVGRDIALGQLAAGVRRDLHPVAKFLQGLLFDRALIGDLRTERVLETLRQHPPDDALSGIHRARFLTIAVRAPKPTPASELFEDLYARTAEGAEADPELERVAEELLTRIMAEEIRIISSKGPPRALGPASSDGIVNTLRQVLPTSPERLDEELDRVVALVVADHIDVIGYFPSGHGEPDQPANGFLASGSEFRDAQFSALYRAVAREISAAIP